MKLSLETSGRHSRVLWFVFGAIAGFAFATFVALQTLFVLSGQGVLK